MDDEARAISLSTTDRARVGVSRGEFDVEIGGREEYPDRDDLGVGETEDGRVHLSVDVLAGDFGTGNADLVLTPEEASALRSALESTIDRLESA